MARDCEPLAMAVSPSLVSGELPHPEIWGGEAGGDRKQLWCPNLGQNNRLTFRPSADSSLIMWLIFTTLRKFVSLRHLT